MAVTALLSSLFGTSAQQIGNPATPMLAIGRALPAVGAPEQQVIGKLEQGLQRGSERCPIMDVRSRSISVSARRHDGTDI